MTVRSIPLAVLGATPDLVIAVPSPGNREAVRAIERAGVRVLVVQDRRLEDLWSSIDTIAGTEREDGLRRRRREHDDPSRRPARRRNGLATPVKRERERARRKEPAGDHLQLSVLPPETIAQLGIGFGPGKDARPP